MMGKLRFSIAVPVVCLASTGGLLADNPTRPGVLRVSVYSDTAAELFWDRSTDDGFIQGYEIHANGVVDAFTDGASYFTDALRQGVHYDFSVTAVDNEGNRSDSASVSFIGGDRGEAGGDGPVQPGNLRAQVYSSSAIEIFWDRVHGQTLSYEISIDGTVGAHRTGNSYFTDELQAARVYTFSVVAIDADGNRSMAASVDAQTTGGGVDPPIGPGAPTHVSLVVYSQTAAELFWDRAPVEDRVVSTEIQRNGVVVGMTEGNSYFDHAREPNTSYLYFLTAIDYQGKRSSSAFYEEPPQIPIINRENHVDLLTHALAAFFGDNYNSLLVHSLDVILGSFLDEALSDADSFPYTHTCSNGGTAFFEESPYEIIFADCLINDAVYDGDYGIQVGNANWLYSDELTVVHLAGETLNFDGTIQVAGNYFYATSEVNVTLMDETSRFLLAAANTEFSFTHLSRCCSSSPNFMAQFNGSFDLFPEILDDNVLSVITLSNFSYSEPMETHSEDWNYRTGVLQLVSTDGSELILDADTGDDSTVTVRISNGGEVDEFVQPWSLWESVLRRTP